MVTQQRSEDIHEISLEPYHSTTTGDGNPDPGLTQTPTTPADAEDNLDYMTKTQAWNLYTTHMLSTWNARTYEFAAILFTASAYPDTLLASSIRGIFNTMASICLSSLIGTWIDRAPSRLRTLLTTIFANRLAVILACACWIFLINDQNVGVGKQTIYPKTTPEQVSWREGFSGTLTSTPLLTKNLLFALAVFLGILEKLSGVANMISMERDWIPILAPQRLGCASSTYDLTHLNAVTRRIDLICKLIAPVWISIIISATNSIRLGILVVAGMSVLSWPADYICARRVYNATPRLNQPKSVGDNLNPSLLPSETSWGSSGIFQWLQRLAKGTIYGLRQYASSMQQYFASDVWMPSFSLAMLHLSVLSFSATFLTYLLDTGFSLILITVVRALSSVVEISSTMITPWGVQYLSRQRHRSEHGNINFEAEEARAGLLEDDGQQEITSGNGAGLERFGLWGISWQVLNTVPVVLALWQLSPESVTMRTTSDTMRSRIITIASPVFNQQVVTFSMFFFLSITRLGLWVFDLTTQELTQTRVPPSTRSSFAGTEMSFVSFFELGHWTLAAIFSKPEHFRYLAVGSLGAVGTAACLYAYWVRTQRGHLLHLDTIEKVCECAKVRARYKI